jgi:cytoskeleton protein RodZ
MSTFGDRLRHERESRGRTLAQIAEATQVQISFLEALERNEFGALPGPAFGKFYIRAYAEVLGFDPRPLIDDYDRERWARERKGREAPRAPRAVARPEPGRAAPPAAPAAPEAAADAAPREPVHAVARESATPPARRARQALRMASLPLLGPLIALGAWISIVVFGPEDMGGEPPGGRAPAGPPAELTSRLDAPGPESAPPAAPAPAAVAPPPPPQPRLTVAEFGVGRDVVEHRLEGRDERFEEGTSVWFHTSVHGGRRGDFVRHVWLREGRAVQSVRLRLGGPRWRTQSSKTVHGEGRWTVEARDEQDRVLARASFTVAVASPVARRAN